MQLQIALKPVHSQSDNTKVSHEVTLVLYSTVVRIARHAIESTSITWYVHRIYHWINSVHPPPVRLSRGLGPNGGCFLWSAF